MFFGKSQNGFFGQSYKVMNGRGNISRSTANMGFKEFFKRKMEKKKAVPEAIPADQLLADLPIFKSAVTPVFNLFVDV